MIFNMAGGGNKINGIIEEYKVATGENISAGDFVTFSPAYNTIEDGIYSNRYLNQRYHNSSILVEDNKILSIYVEWINTTTYNLYASIITVSNDNTVSYNETLLESALSSSYLSNIIKIDNKFAVVNYYDSTTYVYILELDDTSVNVASKTAVGACVYSRIGLINNSKILLVGIESGNIIGKFINISSDWTISSEDSISICTTESYPLDIINIYNNKWLISHCTSGATSHSGIIINIENDSIIPGIDTVLDTYTNAVTISCRSHNLMKINDDTVASIHTRGYGNMYNTLIYIYIEEDIISSNIISHDITSSSTTTGGDLSVCQITPSKAILFHDRYSNNEYVFYGIVSLGQKNGACIQLTTDISSKMGNTAIGDFYDCIKLNKSTDDNRCMFLYKVGGSSSIKELRYHLFSVGEVQSLTDPINILGIAKTSMSNNNTVKVFVP